MIVKVLASKEVEILVVGVQPRVQCSERLEYSQVRLKKGALAAIYTIMMNGPLLFTFYFLLTFI